MSRAVHAIGRGIGIGVSAALATTGVIALRHALETPQPLKSPLPGEALLYRWRRRSIFYKLLGPAEAPPLVLLHTPDIGASAREMQAIMEPLAQTYRVYAPDLLGFGLSDRPNIDYSAAMYSALCQDFLREVVKEPATLLASGLSCNYAVSAASNAPNLCAALVLISPIALQSQAQPGALHQFADTPAVKALLYPLLSTRLGFTLTHGRQQIAQDDFAQFYANTHQLGAEHAAMALLAGKLTEDTTRQFENLQQPMLMIWGMQALEDQRTIASMHEAATLADPARRAREVELIPQAGLAVHVEQPEAVAAAVKRWQSEIAAALPASAESRAFPFPITAQQSAQAIAEPVPLSQKDTAQSRPPLAFNEAATPAEKAIPASSSEAATLAQSEKESAPAQAQTSLNDAKEPQSSSFGKATKTDVKPIMAYCVKCKQKREMRNAREVTMKNGRRAMRGTCAVCGTTLNRLGG